ncbi:MAG: hypothetical protein DMF88_19140 [Acidobacteria bacterium]|nr:MAG: hypothetical protein DMF88_19140 [Acidobacteriota bacterium]
MFGDMPGLVQTITLMPGNYWFTLTVDDGRGGRASQTVTVTVVDNVPPQIGAVFATPTVLGPPWANKRPSPLSLAPGQWKKTVDDSAAATR